MRPDGAERARQASPPASASLGFLFQLLERVEQLAAHESPSGPQAVRIEVGPPSGAEVWRIYAEGGRICWACSDPPRSRFAEHLAAAAACDGDVIDAFLEQCRRTRSPICRSLIDAGVVSPDALRTALGRHAASTLGALAQAAVASGVDFVETVTLQSGSFDSLVHFTGTEIMLYAIERVPELAVEIGELSSHFAEWAPQVRWAGCFRLTGHADPPAVPVACTDASEYSLSEVLRFYRRSVRLARPPTLVATGIEPYAAVVTVDGVGWLLAYRAPLLTLYTVSSSLEVARVLHSVVASASAPGA